MKIITAIMNENLNEKIRQKGQYEVICKDIQYQEALLEIIEKNKDIKILILSNLLSGELSFFELINIIKYKNENIKIIAILDEQNDNTINFLIKIGIKDIFINNKNTIEDIVQTIHNKKEKNELNIETKTRKNIGDIIKEKLVKIKEIKNKKNSTKKIAIIGGKKVGKSLIMILIALQIKNRKSLLINYGKNDLNIIFGKKDNKEIQKYNKNIDFINIEEDLIEIEFQKYDYIFYEIEEIEKEKNLIKGIEKFILIVEPNLIGIKETSQIIENLINKRKIEKEKIKIIYNKINKFSIKNEIMNQIFADFKIIGKIKNDSYYTFLINKNFIIEPIKIKKEYKKIIKELE